MPYKMEFVQNPVLLPTQTRPAPATSGRTQSVTYWPALSAEPGMTGAIPYHTVAFTLQMAPFNAGSVQRRIHEAFQILAVPPRRMSASDVRDDFAAVIEWSSATGRPVIVTSHGKPRAVILSFGAFEKILRLLAKEVLMLGRRRSIVGALATEALETDMNSLSKRLRSRGTAV
jgi:prevent-host-death family protein